MRKVFLPILPAALLCFAIGVGNGLGDACNGLAEHISAVAQSQRCATSAIRSVQTEGGNFVDQSWSFDILCSGNQLHFVATISAILREVLTTPPVSGLQTLNLRSNEIRDGASVPKLGH